MPLKLQNANNSKAGPLKNLHGNMGGRHLNKILPLETKNKAMAFKGENFHGAVLYITTLLY